MNMMNLEMNYEKKESFAFEEGRFFVYAADYWIDIYTEKNGD